LLARHLDGLFSEYIGCDLTPYNGFPVAAWARWVKVDLNASRYPLEGEQAQLVIALETIEHVENPRGMVREMVRLLRPGGLLVLSTPNQLSLLSKLSLCFKNQFNAFQEAPGLYPAHITALLEADLVRILWESGLSDIEINYTDQGRFPFTPWHWPNWLGLKGRPFSDNVIASGLKKSQ
jgi:2-polyprenyl-3-methyl-5-hydroxy-6-metoxy-1,4-benzoquinol methylase